jgi:hypothetical protein
VKQELPVDVKLKDDDWWKKVRIDIRDGLLATELTPPQYVGERLSLVIPNSLESFALKQAQEWTRYLGAASTPTEESSGTAPVRIDAPRQGSFVKGKVTITGKAVSDHFVGYRVEVGAGESPAEWETLVSSLEPQSGGELAEWDTRGLDDGLYTIRIVLVDSERGILITFVRVNVGENIRRNPTPEPTPTVDFDFGGGGDD